MTQYPFNTGLIVGRFQIFHNGHKQMVQTALNSCERVLIFIGSSQEENTQKNPFAYSKRSYIIQSVFTQQIKEGRLLIHPLPDIGVGNNSQWGDYVLTQARETYYFNPELLISGKEERRTGWFDTSIAELFVPKSIAVSATRIREAMLRDDKEFWHQFTPSVLWNEYDKLRETLVAAQANQATASI